MLKLNCNIFQRPKRLQFKRQYLWNATVDLNCEDLFLCMTSFYLHECLVVHILGVFILVLAVVDRGSVWLLLPTGVLHGPGLGGPHGVRRVPPYRQTPPFSGAAERGA